MAIGIGIGVGLKKKRISWGAWWAQLMDCIWVGGYNGDNLKDISGNENDIVVTGKDWSGSYIPPTTSAKFVMPDVAALIADDNDNLWFTAGGDQKDVTHANMITLLNGRTLIKYDSAAPHNIRAIGLLKSTVVLTTEEKDRATRDFQLYLMYFEEWNDLGYAKENL